MQHVVKGKAKPNPPAPKRLREAHIKELGGGGFTTSISSRPTGDEVKMGGYQPPVEAAHKSYKHARKHVDQHFSDQPIGEDETAGE